MTALSVVISIVLTSHFDILEKINRVEKTFGAVTDTEAQSLFEDIFTSYHANFDQKVQPSMLKTWAHEALTVLHEDMKDSAISLPHKSGEPLLLNIYSRANDHIVSTHVGSLSKYNTTVKYSSAEKVAIEKGVPVIRFYLFDGIYQKREPLAKGGEPVMDETTNPALREYIQFEQNGQSRKEVTLEQYIKQVKTLHDRTPTVMSIVIPPRFNGHQKRNLVMADGKIVAETTKDGTMIRITGNSRKLNEARNYLRELLGLIVKSNEHFYMNDTDIDAKFVRFARAIEKRKEPEKPKAKALAEHLLSQTRSE